MNSKKNISESARFIFRFGLLRGIQLYLKIKLGNNKDIRVPGIKHPLSLRKNSSDYDTFYQAIVHNHYQFNYGIKPKVVIDGGANIGLASIAFKNMFPDTMVIAIEPDADNYTVLQKNLSNYTNIHTENAGLWNKEAFLKVTDKFNVGKWGMVTEEVSEDGVGIIKTITINDILKKYELEQIDILKLDIETAEKELFSSDYELWLPKAKVIIIELHDFICSGTAKPFFMAINNSIKDYRFFQLGENTIIINDDIG